MTRSPHYVLALLTLVYAVNYIDRQVVSILMPQLRAEFGVSDTLLGLLAGPAFALFYAVVGVPLALVADRVGRKRVIVVSLACFSCVTFVAGLVTRFGQLLATRMATGIGEAGTGPAAQSIIADLYPPRHRVTAQSIYAIGVNLGIMVAFFFGGRIAQAWGWRVTFMAAGAPGIVLTLLIAATLREPGPARLAPVRPTARPSIGIVAGRLWANPTYRWMAAGAAMTCFSGYATVAFFPSFLSRSYAMGAASAGLVMALSVGVVGGVLTAGAGPLVDRLSRRDPRWALWVPALAVLAAVPVAPLAYLAADARVAIAAGLLPLATSVVFVGPIVALTQSLVPAEMRSTAVALLILTDNLVGLGLGPQTVGGLSDLLAPSLGQNSLRFALLIGTTGYLMSALCFARAGRLMPTGVAAVAILAPADHQTTTTR